MRAIARRTKQLRTIANLPRRHGGFPKAVGESPAQLPGMERFSMRSKLIAIKLCAVSEMHAKVRRAHKVVAKIWRTPARLIVSVSFEQLLIINNVSWQIAGFHTLFPGMLTPQNTSVIFTWRSQLYATACFALSNGPFRASKRPVLQSRTAAPAF